MVLAMTPTIRAGKVPGAFMVTGTKKETIKCPSQSKKCGLLPSISTLGEGGILQKSPEPKQERRVVGGIAGIPNGFPKEQKIPTWMILRVFAGLGHQDTRTLIQTVLFLYLLLPKVEALNLRS
jgi:hypothetical protein